jgi:hypothetical protein
MGWGHGRCPTAPLQRFLAAQTLPADLVGVVEHGVLYGRLLTHTWLENVDSKSAVNQL